MIVAENHSSACHGLGSVCLTRSPANSSEPQVCLSLLAGIWGKLLKATCPKAASVGHKQAGGVVAAGDQVLGP